MIYLYLFGTCFHFIYVFMIIGNNVWVGSEVTLLKGTVIPDGSVVGYGSIVTKAFDEESVIIVGSPAKIVKRNIRWNA